MSRLIAFALYDSGGSPLTSATPTFAVYKGADRVNRTPPAIVNRGGGVYAFTVPTADDLAGVAFLISGGAGSYPPYIAGADGGTVQTFALYDGDGNPLAGQSPAFATYLNASGAALPSPAIVDFTSGLYAFVIATADFDIGVAYEISTGATPARVNGFAQLEGAAPTANAPNLPAVQASPGADAYAHQLRQLLPPSSFWKLEPTGWLFKVLQALADALARVGDRGDALMAETLPNTAIETLGDWERVLGLPDECLTEIPTSISERQIAILSKYTAQGGQTPAYFVAVAAALGYTASVSTYTVCRSGAAHSGDPIYDESWAFAWLITISGFTVGSVTIARSGSAHSGDRLEGFGQLDIECIINRLAPAHTIPLFEYTL